MLDTMSVQRQALSGGVTMVLELANKRSAWVEKCNVSDFCRIPTITRIFVIYDESLICRLMKIIEISAFSGESDVCYLKQQPKSISNEAGKKSMFGKCLLDPIDDMDL